METLNAIIDKSCPQKSMYVSKDTSPSYCISRHPFYRQTRPVLISFSMINHELHLCSKRAGRQKMELMHSLHKEPITEDNSSLDHKKL